MRILGFDYNINLGGYDINLKVVEIKKQEDILVYNIYKINSGKSGDSNSQAQNTNQQSELLQSVLRYMGYITSSKNSNTQFDLYIFVYSPCSNDNCKDLLEPDEVIKFIKKIASSILRRNKNNVVLPFILITDEVEFLLGRRYQLPSFYIYPECIKRKKVSYIWESETHGGHHNGGN